MKKLTLYLLSIVVLFFTACSSDDNNNEPPYPTVSSIPDLAFEGENINITGSNFTEKIWVEINDNKIILNSLSATELSFTMPEDILDPFEKERNVTLWVKTTLADGTISSVTSKSITVKFKEPNTGWFPLTKITLNTMFDEYYTFATTSEKTLWAHGKQCILRSTDGGQNWSTIAHGSTYGNAAHFINDNSGWIDLLNKELYYFTDFTNAQSFIEADLTSNTLAETYKGWMAGCWAETYNSGIVAYPNAIISFDGGFSDDKTSLLYSNASIDLTKFTALSKVNFVAYGYDQQLSKTYLIIKQANQGVFEHEVTSYLPENSGIQKLQLMPDNTIFFTSNNKLFKLSSTLSISEISQPASQFLAVSNELIYVLYDSKVFKTENGGQSWTEEASVDSGYSYPVSILEKNGFIWVIFKNAETAEHVIIKYNH